MIPGLSVWSRQILSTNTQFVYHITLILEGIFKKGPKAAISVF
jgi:hypothetical protein